MGFLRSTGNLLDKISTIGIVLPTNGTIWFAYQLRDNVQVADRAKKINQLTKLLIGVNLFEMGLRQPFRITSVIPVRPLQDDVVILNHQFFFNHWSLTVVLAEAQTVFPCFCFFFGANFHIDEKIRIPTSCQATETRDAIPFPNSFLKASTHRNDVPKETEHIEKVRLPGGIRTDEEDAALKN